VEQELLTIPEFISGFSRVRFALCNVLQISAVCFLVLFNLHPNASPSFNFGFIFHGDFQKAGVFAGTKTDGKYHF
jgi:hypothetical protein